MAGIGFELRRVLTAGRLSSSVQATLSGVMIVAGPWLLTIVTIFSIQQIFQVVHMPQQSLFQAASIYSYAFSLSVFSAVHFLFIRLVADLIWLKQERVAAGWLAWFALGVAVLSVVTGGVAVAWMPLPGVENPLLFKVAVVALFVAVNLLWIAMLFVSLLRKYGRIMVVYVLGMALSVALVAWWGPRWGVGGAVLGFAVGHALIVGALLAFCWQEFPPVRAQAPWAEVWKYVKKCRLLILSGLLFYSAQWIDKMVFWFTRGTSVEGTAFHLFPPYDLTVYVAGLTIIPGLVYFVLFLETSFYASLHKFIRSLVAEAYANILKIRFQLVRTMKEELRDQLVFQGIFSAAVAALIVWAFPEAQWRLMLWGLAGAYFQLLLMTLLNLLYYLELFPEALVGTAVFWVAQVAFAFLGLEFPELEPGVGFLAAALLGCGTTYALLLRSVRFVDRAIFVRSAG